MMINKMALFTKHPKLVAPQRRGHRSTSSSSSSSSSSGGLHQAMAPMIAVAQVFGLMPLHGVRGATLDPLHFRWLSPRTGYSLLASVGILVTSSLYLAKFVKDADFEHMVSVLFYACPVVGYLLFVRVAVRWLALNREWLAMAVAMRKYDRQPHFSRWLKGAIVLLAAMALGEHVLSVLSVLNSARQCPGFAASPLKAYFSTCCSEMFVLTEYAHWKALLTEVPVLMATFHWTFLDLFLTVVSAALAGRFQQLNRAVHRTMVKDALFWREVREDYTRLWTLTRTLDQSVCHLITLSFGSNLFFICWQMFNSLRPMKGALETTYFFFSFGCLLARTATVSVYCCWIHDESKEMLLSLFNLPSEYYGTEASRLIQQICACPPALTGSNYFAVTRGLCLQVAGAIITFEIILVQIGPAFLKTDDEQELLCLILPNY